MSPFPHPYQLLLQANYTGSIDENTRVLQVSFLEKQLCKWTRCVKEGVSRFGGNRVSKVVQAIKDNALRFHKPPLGPVGDIMCLKDTQ